MGSTNALKAGPLSASELKPGERKTATILFADMKGFTALSERMDPEEMDGLMNRLFGSFESIIRSHGGTVEKYIGDALVAVFGVPELHEDDPQRAIGAALTFIGREDPCRAAKTECVEASFRIGIHTGLVATGTRGEFDVVTGHAMAVAQRLQAEAEPGGILVSEAVKLHCDRDFDFSGPFELQAKGKKDLIQAWAVSGVSQGALKEAGPFIGRKELVDELLRLYLRHDAGQLAGRCLIGEAGIGKTRLAQALADKIRSFPDFSSPLLMARAQKYRPGRYAVVMDLAMERLGLDQDAGYDELKAALSALEGLDEGQARILAGLVSARDSAEDEGDAIPALFALFSILMGANAAAIYSPFIFIDNAQALDRSSREFLQYYGKHGATKPFILLAGREHSQALRDAFPELKPQRLSPLSDDEARALTLAFWPECPDELLKAILAQSLGNPLFLREYAQFAKKHRDLSALPSTIQTMFLTSLERYEPPYREFIKMMSPFVLNFTEGDAARVVAAAGERVADSAKALELFVRDGLLTKSGERYAFALDVLKKALYASLLNHNKRLIHCAIADLMLESKRPNRLRLIHHLLRAERWAEAAAVMLKDPARNYCYEYLEYLDPLYRRLSKGSADQAMQLLILKSALLFNAGKIDEAEQELKNIMKAAVSQQNDNCMGFAYHMICAHAAMSYAFQKARFTGQKALYYYRGAGMSPRSVQNVIRTIAWAEIQKNNFEEAKALVDQTELIPERDAFELYSARAELRLFSGDYRGALEALDRQGASPADDGYDAVARFFGMDLRIKALWQLCDFSALGQAARDLLAAGSLSESVLAQAHAMAACSQTLAGQEEASRDGFLRAEFYAGQIRNDFDRVEALRSLALCRLVSGDTEKAESTAKEALIPALRHCCYYPAFTLLMILVGLEYERAKREQARFYLKEASYFFTTGLLLPYKDVILYYYYAASLFEGESAERAPGIARKLLEDEKARIGKPELVEAFLNLRGFGDIERRLAGAGGQAQ